MATSLFAERVRKAFRAVGIGIAPATTTADADVPLLTAGSGAASASDPNGSLRLRTDGPAEMRHGGAWVRVHAPVIIADPGDAGAIPVTHSGGCALVSAGAETRTIAAPTFRGQRIELWCDTYGGDIVITAAAAINVANNNTMTFGAVSEAIVLVAVTVGGTLVWQVSGNDNVGLTTV